MDWHLLNMRINITSYMNKSNAKAIKIEATHNREFSKLENKLNFYGINKMRKIPNKSHSPTH